MSTDESRPELISKLVLSVEAYNRKFLRDQTPLCEKIHEDGSVENPLLVTLVKLKSLVRSWTHLHVENYTVLYTKITGTKVVGENCQMMTDWLIGGGVWIKLSHTPAEIKSAIGTISSALGSLSKSVLVPEEIAGEAIDEDTIDQILSESHWVLFFFLFCHSEYP